MLAAVALLLATGPAAAPPCTVGDWVMKVGETPLWGLRIGNAATRATATWARPDRFDLDGDSFSDVRGPVVERSLQSARMVDGDLELTFDDPRPDATPDIFRATCDRGGHLKVAYVGVRFEPFDFARASAQVFQHGHVDDDFLKAHLLAMVAIARGEPKAIWIATATLDRYLQRIGRPQVAGTQFTMPLHQAATQEPYNRTLIPDTMRAALHVPPLAEQERQREAYTKESLSSAKP